MCRNWSDCTDAQSEFGLRWSHMSNSRFLFGCDHAICANQDQIAHAQSGFDKWATPCEKVSSEHMRTEKAKISLRIRAVWTWPSLSANGSILCYSMFQCRRNARMRLCACAEWFESAYFAHIRKHFFAWRGPFGVWRAFSLTEPLQMQNRHVTYATSLISSYTSSWCNLYGKLKLDLLSATIVIRLSGRAVWSWSTLVAYTIKLQWLEYLWDHENLFEGWVVQASGI